MLILSRLLYFYINVFRKPVFKVLELFYKIIWILHRIFLAHKKGKTSKKKYILNKVSTYWIDRTVDFKNFLLNILPQHKIFPRKSCFCSNIFPDFFYCMLYCLCCIIQICLYYCTVIILIILKLTDLKKFASDIL